MNSEPANKRVFSPPQKEKAVNDKKEDKKTKKAKENAEAEANEENHSENGEAKTNEVSGRRSSQPQEVQGITELRYTV